MWSDIKSILAWPWLLCCLMQKGIYASNRIPTFVIVVVAGFGVLLNRKKDGVCKVDLIKV